MKRLYKILFLCLSLLSIGFTSSLTAQNKLSEHSYIALLSCEPGPAVYAKFGHTGIRVVDTLQHMDITFHYGIFNFDTPFFIAKFVQGATDYEVGLASTDYFLQEYINRNSTVHEQVLNLTYQERSKLFDALIENYKPENRLYRYNFIFDNCATRPFHIITRSLSDPINFSNQDSITTYRTIIDEYVGYNNWLRFGIDLVIGASADKKIHEIKTISFPLYLMNYFQKGEINRATGVEPLVKTNHPVFVATPSEEVHSTIFDSPMWVTSIILLLVIICTIIEKIRHKYFVALDILIFTIYGLMGCIIFFLMFISEHPLVDCNYNLLWLNPLQLVFAICLFWPKIRRNLRYYAYLNILLTIVAIIILISQHQLMHIAFIPMMIISLLRSISYIYQKALFAKRESK